MVAVRAHFAIRVTSRSIPARAGPTNLGVNGYDKSLHSRVPHHLDATTLPPSFLLQILIASSTPTAYITLTSALRAGVSPLAARHVPAAKRSWCRLRNRLMSKKLHRKQKKRATILAAAVAEFHDHGFDRTSMDQISATAGASKRTVYNHFPSKEELFDAMVQTLQERCDDLAFPYSSDRPLDDQLMEIGTRYLELMSSDEFMQLSRIVLSRFIQHPARAENVIRGQGDTQAAVTKWMEAAVQDNRLSVSTPETAAIQFTAMLGAFAFWPQLIAGAERPTKERIEDIVKTAVEIFLQGTTVAT